MLVCKSTGKGKMQLKKTIEISIPAEMQFTDVVCLTLYGIASKAGFSFEDIEDLKVAVSEACHSLVVKTDGPATERTIRIRFDMEEEGLRVFVRSGETSLRRLNPGMMDWHEGGAGLYLMQALVDEIEVHTEAGTEVVLMKYRTRSEQFS